MKYSKEEIQSTKDKLRALLQPGDIVYTNLLHVSRSGMYRAISLIFIRENEPFDISGMAAKLLEGYDRRHGGCKASGCGMDMGFHLVYSLSFVLWPEGFQCIGEKCPANDHLNGDGNREPHQHRDGGYALIQKWL